MQAAAGLFIPPRLFKIHRTRHFKNAALLINCTTSDTV